MELYERIALVRKAAGLSQEQLGERLDVSRQAVSKWESGQTTPDALTIAKLCLTLGVSADYLLLGKEPEAGSDASGEEESDLPKPCPCCGREVFGSLCPGCGYTLPHHPAPGPRYALVSTWFSCPVRGEIRKLLQRYCGLTDTDLSRLEERIGSSVSHALLRRDLNDSAAVWIASHLDIIQSSLRIVADNGEEEAELLYRESALPLPPSTNSGLGFWGVVGAIMVALILTLLLLSFL